MQQLQLRCLDVKAADGAVCGGHVWGLWGFEESGR